MALASLVVCAHEPTTRVLRRVLEDLGLVVEHRTSTAAAEECLSHVRRVETNERVLANLSTMDGFGLDFLDGAFGTLLGNRRGRHCRSRRTDSGLDGMEGSDQEHAPGEPRRRTHALAALLCRKCAMGVREPPAGGLARVCHHRSALAGQVSRQWLGGEHARVREDIWVQSGPADGESAGKGLQGLVRNRRLRLPQGLKPYLLQLTQHC